MLPLAAPQAIIRSGALPLSTTTKGAVASVKRRIACRPALGILLGFLVSLTVLGSPVWAQKYVFNNASFPTGIRPVWVVTGDFNKDGIADVAVVNQCGSDPTCLSTGTISVLLGNPDGTFQKHVDYPTGSLPRFAIAGDFNGDGISDLAVANLGSNTISILLGNADGTFQSHVDYAVGSGPVSVTVGDFNGDGKLDLAVANSGSQLVSILLGNGDGTFQSHVDYATSFAPQSVTTADFNGDGHLDLAVADLNVSVLLGKGDGTFQTPVEYPGNGASFVAVGDFNGDGKVDLAATEGFADSISILLGNGDGTFRTPPVSYEVGGGPESLIPIDLNGDGHLDLAVAVGVGGGGPNVSGTLSILLNKGDGTFQSHRDFGGMTTVSVAAADFNGDGKPDLAVPNRDFNTVNILLGDGHGAFGSILDNLTQVVPPTQVIAGDFNGDGKLDLSFALQSSGSVGVILGNGDGSFQPALLDNAPGGGLSIATGDFNGDGKLDVAAFVGSELNNMQILLGNGDGTFRPRLTFAVSNNPGQVLTGDFNGDGKLDLLAVGFGFDVMLGNGDGTFQSAMSFPSLLSSGALVADFNADKKLDLAVISAGSNTLTIFLGNGDGTFKPGVGYATGSAPVAIAAADFNGDGKLDLAVANAGDNTVSVFIGNGDGTFQPHVDFPAIQSLRSLTAGDFDGDGKTDLMTAGNGVSFLFGNGDGTFRPHVDYFTSLAVTSALTADLNGDGRSDLAVANPFAATVSAILNRPAVALRPTQLSFPRQLVGTQGLPQTVTIYNPGMVPLGVQSVSTSADFSQTNTCGTSVAPAANCTISVTFVPTAAGNRSSALTITDNASGSPQTVSLTATATDFSLAAATGANCPAAGNCSISATVTAGQTATYDLQVSPVSGFNGIVSLTCTAVPSSLTCSVSPASVPPSGSSSYAFSVSVSNTSSVMTLHLTPGMPELPVRYRILPVSALALVLVFVCVAIVAGQAKRLRVPALFVLLLSLGYVSGCSHGGGAKPPTNATITVTGTSSGANRTLALSLTVNH